MTQTTLRAVTLKTVANYTQAAERALGAYRSGGHRLISALQRGVDRAAKQGSERLAPRLANALRRASGNVGGLAAKGLDAVSRRTEQAIGLGSTNMTTQLGRVADLVDGVDNRVLASGVQAAVRLSLPGAKAALALSRRVAAGADKLAGMAQNTAEKSAHNTAHNKAHNTAQKAVPRTPAPSASKAPAKSASKAAAGRRAASVAAAVDAPVKAAVRRAASTVKRASKAVAPVIAEASATVKAKATPKARAKVAGKAAATPAKAARARRPVRVAAAPADATSAA